jgi:hypothetical protein
MLTQRISLSVLALPIPKTSIKRRFITRSFNRFRHHLPAFSLQLPDLLVEGFNALIQGPEHIILLADLYVSPARLKAERIPFFLNLQQLLLQITDLAFDLFDHSDSKYPRNLIKEEPLPTSALPQNNANDFTKIFRINQGQNFSPKKRS